MNGLTSGAMTGTTTTEPAVDDRPLWAIAQYDGPNGREPWAVSQTEIEREMGGATRTLGALGVERDRRVLWCSVTSEAAHFWPLMIATMLTGAQFSLADATAPDAARLAMFLRRLDYHAVMGINDALLDGLSKLGLSHADVFGDVAVLGARPGAYERLGAAGLDPHWFVLCGPAVAISAAAGEPALVDSDEWTLGHDGTHVLVTNLRPRATTFAATPTAIRAEHIDQSEGSFVPQTNPTQPTKGRP